MFRKLLKKEVSTSKNTPSLAPGITAAIYQVAGRNGIPSMPAAAQKAFQVATNPDAEAHDFVSIIESDEALSARVLKIANSVYFDRGTKSETIDEAVHVIGLNELRCLLNATTLSEIFPSENPLRNHLWQHDIATGLIARQLAQLLSPAKEETAFLAGLMHDIGKLFLLQRAPAEYQEIITVIQNEGIGFQKAEEQFFPFDHTEVGQLIAEKWNFSQELITAISSHHLPWEELETDEEHFLVICIKAADTIAHSHGFGHPKGFGKFQNEASSKLDTVWEFLKLQPDQHRQIMEESKRVFELESDLYGEAVA